MMFIILSLSSFSNHVPPIFCLSLCLIYLSIWHKSTKMKQNNSHNVSAIFHFSLFTLHFSLKETVTPILHSSFFILHSSFKNRVSAIFHSSLFTLHFSLKETSLIFFILHSSFKNRVSAFFHFSLFTFHFSLKETVTPILHSSFFILH